MQQTSQVPDFEQMMRARMSGLMGSQLVRRSSNNLTNPAGASAHGSVGRAASGLCRMATGPGSTGDASSNLLPRVLLAAGLSTSRHAGIHGASGLVRNSSGFSGISRMEPSASTAQLSLLGTRRAQKTADRVVPAAWRQHLSSDIDPSHLNSTVSDILLSHDVSSHAPQHLLASMVMLVSAPYINACIILFKGLRLQLLHSHFLHIIAQPINHTYQQLHVLPYNI